MNKPLAERMRPTTFSQFVGQQKLIGPNGSLMPLLKSKMVPSMILWGPPGVGKTTLAQLIAQESGRDFFTLSAISSGVKEVRAVIDKAEKKGLFEKASTPILFIDEIHRFSKAQQDSLLGAVEKGIVVLIGATTENPSFEVISALLSRCQVYTLHHFDLEELNHLLDRALEEDEWLKNREIDLKDRTALIRFSGGDARKLLNNLELVVGNQPIGAEITDKLVEGALMETAAFYDKNGEQHYDIISAFIKSIRGSDPNAGVYWLARMIEGGEKPEFIARRLLILATEDVGLANPNALLLANATFDAVQKIGWPESRIILSQCVIYLATSPKSNAAYMAIGKAQQLVRQENPAPVPLHLRNAPTSLMKDLGYGAEYKYAHDFPGHFVNQEYMPEQHSGLRLYEPSPNEKKAKDALKHLWPKYNY